MKGFFNSVDPHPIRNGYNISQGGPTSERSSGVVRSTPLYELCFQRIDPVQSTLRSGTRPMRICNPDAQYFEVICKGSRGGKLLRIRFHVAALIQVNQTNPRSLLSCRQLALVKLDTHHPERLDKFVPCTWILFITSI